MEMMDVTADANHNEQRRFLFDGCKVAQIIFISQTLDAFFVRFVFSIQSILRQEQSRSLNSERAYFQVAQQAAAEGSVSPSHDYFVTSQWFYDMTWNDYER